MRFMYQMGFYPRKFLLFFRNFPGYLKDYRRLKKDIVKTNLEKKWPLGKLYPALDDKSDESGVLKGVYFHQDLLVAKKIYQRKPLRHVDIGSRTDGFVAHVATFMPIEIIDIRPQNSKVDNINFLQADLMNPVKEDLQGCTDSISSLHAIEHFGLGRYGDPIDVNGYVKALDNIYRMLKKGGTFYFSVPLGPQRIEFNGHRVFSLEYLLSLVKEKYEINSFSFVDDKGDLFQDVALTKQMVDSNCGCQYGCAIFDLLKL